MNFLNERLEFAYFFILTCMKKGLLAVLAVLVVLGFWIMGTYNSLVSLDVGIETAWSQVETQYQRRFDVIPNLVETVKGVANFEQSTYVAVTEARSAWAQAKESGSRTEQIAAAGQVESALSRLLVTVENYPQLKASENFSTLQAQIEGTENRIAVARKDFNDAVRPYNEKVRVFPGMMVAKIFGFDVEPFFESQEGADTAPRVNFGG